MITKEEVRDGYLNDLPSDLIDKLMKISKLIADTCRDEIRSKDYDDIRNDLWCKSALDEFCTTPKDKSHVGSVRVYKKGKRFSCMIQITGHVDNLRDNFTKELFHEFIRDVHTTVRPKVRRKYDMTVTCESEHGEHFEGFDVWTKQKVAKEIWEKFEDKKTLKIKPIKESAEMDKNIKRESVTVSLEELPIGLQSTILNMNESITDSIQEYLNESDLVDGTFKGKFFESLMDDSVVGHTELHCTNDGQYSGTITITPPVNINYNEYTSNEFLESFKDIYRQSYLENYDLITEAELYVEGSKNRSKLKNKLQDEVKSKELDGNKKKRNRRMENFLKRHNYDPKTNTIETDIKDKNGKKQRVEFKINQLPDFYSFSGVKEVKDLWSKDLSKYIITMPEKDLKRKPAFSNSIFKHEEGHLDYFTNPAKYKKEAREVLGMLNNVGDEIHDHDRNFMEYIADHYAKNHSGYGIKGMDKMMNTIQRGRKDIDTILKSTKKMIVAATALEDDKYDALNIKNKYNEILINIKLCIEDTNKTEEIISKLRKELNNDKKHEEQIKDELFYQMNKLDEYRKKLKKEKESFIQIRNKLNTIYKNIEKEYQEEINEMQNDNRAAISNEYTKANRGTRLRQKYLHSTESYECFNKNLVISGTKPNYYFEFTLEPTYVEALWNYLNEHVDEPMTEAVKVDKDKIYINTDMSIPEAKRTLGTLCMNIINNISRNNLPNQYTANIINNIVSKNLLPVWSKGYRKFTIIIDPKHHGMLQFKIPAVTHDFASKFVYGRESMNAFLHKNSDIKIIISPKVFKTLKNRDDLFFFIKDAIKYYDTNLIKYSEMIMHSLMRLNPGLKHTIANSKLSGIVACSLQMLVMFDDIDMSSKDVFKFNKEDINTVTSFIKNIYSNYASPEKEKKKILDDLQSIIDKIKGNIEYDENVKSIIDLTNVFNEFYSGKFNDDIEYYREACMKDCIDADWSNNNPNTEIRMLQEATKIKKLKKLPRDLVAYISIEAESIRDANDKLMIASYCLDKLEIVEWYIELLEVGSKRYIVPHPMSYLRSLRTQLLQCYDKIMKVKIIPPSERPLIDIKY